MLGNTDNNEFQQVTVQRGNVYVGATNTILQFSSSLNEISRFENGPGNDSSYCGGPPYCDLGNLCQSNQRCSNNYNRLLIPYRDRLLACGTLHEVCDLLELEDIANIYGIPRELKCRDENTVQYVAVGSRNLESPLVGAIQTNAEYPDRDLLYLGRPDHFIQVLFAPSEPNPYFTQVDQFIETAFNRVAKYHLAWTTADYGYMLWTNSTTEETKLSRYCNSIMSESSRDSFREEFDSPSLGPRTYTEISIQCRGSNMQVLSSLVTAKYIFDQLFVLYQDGSETAVCATNITHLNQQFDFVRDRCWNSTEGSLYAKYMNPGSNCTHYDFYEEEWVCICMSCFVSLIRMCTDHWRN